MQWTETWPILKTFATDVDQMQEPYQLPPGILRPQPMPNSQRGDNQGYVPVPQVQNCVRPTTSQEWVNQQVNEIAGSPVHAELIEPQETLVAEGMKIDATTGKRLPESAEGLISLYHEFFFVEACCGGIKSHHNLLC